MIRRPENRLTVVDENGCVCEKWNVQIDESVQDNGRTLKLFVKCVTDEVKNE